MTNPYQDKPDAAFWRRSVSGRTAEDIDPVVNAPFRIGPSDRIATAGSCFAQHIARTLRDRGMKYLVTEERPGTPGAADENYGVFPARFANIYTVRQLLQLFQRAYGLFDPAERVWRDARGRYLDPFRPRIQTDGFATADEVEEDREAHLDAVQTMFETCNVLVFTLGLTEGWVSTKDGAVFPVPPGVVTNDVPADGYAYHNFTVAEMTADLTTFIGLLRRINPGVRVILTVSPVALVATYEDRHVLVSNTYSKAALRVVAEEVSRAVEGCAYFPSYEIITSAAAGQRFLESDLREVRPEGVAYVMSIFQKHFIGLSDSHPVAAAPRPRAAETAISQSIRAEQRVICEEELLDRRDV
ncbi:MAG: GSCFA domain-containing protein [Micropepsaceae bacterium]